MDVRSVVARNALRFRLERRLTQEELSVASGLSQQYISGLERGKRNPTVLTLYEIAQALKVRPADLLQE